MLLLQGWTMLEECCDQCNVPLMRSKDKKQELCVECKRNYVPEVKAPVKNTAAPQTEQIVTTKVAPAQL